jgi:hypothetical protein
MRGQFLAEDFLWTKNAASFDATIPKARPRNRLPPNPQDNLERPSSS